MPCLPSTSPLTPPPKAQVFRLRAGKHKKSPLTLLHLSNGNHVIIRCLPETADLLNLDSISSTSDLSSHLISSHPSPVQFTSLVKSNKHLAPPTNQHDTSACSLSHIAASGYTCVRPILPYSPLPVVECWLKISDLQQSASSTLRDADRSSANRQYVFGNPAPELVPAQSPPSTCGPKIATVGRVTTITIESIVTLTHLCYTQTLTTKRLAGASGTFSATLLPSCPHISLLYFAVTFLRLRVSRHKRFHAY